MNESLACLYVEAALSYLPLNCRREPGCIVLRNTPDDFRRKLSLEYREPECTYLQPPCPCRFHHTLLQGYSMPGHNSREAHPMFFCRSPAPASASPQPSDNHPYRCKTGQDCLMILHN